MKLQLKVTNMTCGGCVSAITKAIKTVDANASIQCDPKTKIVLVETESSESAIKTAISQIGYSSS
jgi:copper chaperone